MSDSMDPKAKAAREKVEAQLGRDIPLVFESMFPKLTGWGAEKQNNKRVALFNSLAPVLKQVLHDSETVQFVSKGVVNLWWEMFFMGVWAQLINRTAMVLTDQRLILIHLKKDKPASFINQVPIGAIKTISASWGSLTIKMGKGKISLGGVPGPDRKILGKALEKNRAASGGLEHLCPSCYASHTTHKIGCSHCQARFKSPKVAALRSAILPGLGDLYLGHKLFGTLEMFGSVFVWLIAIVALVEGVESGNLIVGVVTAGVILLLANGVDAIMTYAQGQKGMMSTGGKLATRPSGVAPAAAGSSSPQSGW